MNEIKLAIEYFESALKNADEFLLRGISCERMAKQKARLELSIPILRAELSRQENAPLTCDGCKWHPIKYDFLNSMISRCQNCSRGTILVDRYESKEKIK